MLYHLYWTLYIYNVTRGKVKTPKRVGLAVLLKILTGSAELVKVRQTLSRVGDSFDIPNGLFLDVENFLYVCCLRFSVN